MIRTVRRQTARAALLGALVTAPMIGMAAAPAAAAEPVREAAAVAVLPSELPYGPDTCKNGFVWREARPSDLVCVTPEVRQTTADENALAASRREPNGGAYGPDTCKPGFVWREAFDGDVVCVTPDRRTQAKSDNAAAESRKEISGAAQAGTQTVTLNVANSRSARGLKEFDTVFEDCDASRVLESSTNSVGWMQSEDNCNFAFVAQLAVQFDTAPLDAIPDKRIDRVVLTYDEDGQRCGDPSTHPLPVPPGTPSEPCWQSGDGKPEHKPNGCVVVRVPAKEWVNSPTKELRPHVTGSHPTITRNSPNEWDVTEPFRWQTDPQSKPLTAPGQPPVNAGFGFLLTGEFTSLDQLTGDDDTHCLSRVANVQLHVTYTVLPPGGPGPIVK